MSVPTPRYEMRRRLALRVIAGLTPGRFLELGCGWGELLPALHTYGFDGVAVEPWNEARLVAAKQVRQAGADIRVLGSVDSLVGEMFDYLFAFEVLEHIEDDVAELRRWCAYLSPGGLCIISVPAHRRFWSAADAAVGHYRRYERIDLLRLHEAVGLEIIQHWSYGFPVTTITRRLRQLVSVSVDESLTQQQRTESSSIVSHAALGGSSRGMSILMRAFGWLADAAQRPFLRGDLGDGYFVISRRI